jgi:small-conductance mechanosensitive channel
LNHEKDQFYNRAKDAVPRLIARNQQLEAEVAQHPRQITALTTTNTQLTNTNNELQQRVNRLESDVSVKEGTIQFWMAKYAILEEAAETRKKSFYAAKEENAELERQASSMVPGQN